MDDKKIAFIFGSSKEEKNIHEGNIDRIGNIKDGSFHSTCLIEYGKEKYPEVSIFQQLTNRHMPEAISYFFIDKFNHAVFLNTTKYLDDGRVGKHGKEGVLMLPNQLTEKQKEGIEKFLDEVCDYSVSILYNLNIDTGMIDGSEIVSISKEDPHSVFKSYLEKTKTKSL